MSQAVTLHLPDELIERARDVAAQTRRPLEEVLIEWLHDGARKPPIASLTDEQVLALADLQLDAATQQELSDLLALNREGALDEAGHSRLDELMGVYGEGMVRKAEAYAIAVERGLKPPLSQPHDAARS